MGGDVSSYAIEEARDIFGDVSVLLDDHRQREVLSMDQEEEAGDDGYGRHGWKGRLEQQFEPSLLAERYMTEKDDLIRETDVPERIQVSTIPGHKLLSMWERDSTGSCPS